MPALGGMARPDGVVIASERYFAFANRDGSILEGEMPTLPSYLRRIPLARGLARLGMSVSPLLRRDGVAGQGERLVLLAVFLAPIAFVFLSGTVSLVAGILMSVGLLAWIMRGRTLYLHGAEHRAIAAAEEGKLGATWQDEVQPSRFSLRCGTNFVALVLPITLLADRLWPFAPALWTPVVLAVHLARPDDGALACRAGLDKADDARFSVPGSRAAAADDPRADDRRDAARADGGRLGAPPRARA